MISILPLSINPNVTEKPTLAANVSSVSTVPVGTLVTFNCTTPFKFVSTTVYYFFKFNGREVEQTSGSALIPASYNYRVEPSKMGETLNVTCTYRTRHGFDTDESEPSNSIIMVVPGELYLCQCV